MRDWMKRDKVKQEILRILAEKFRSRLERSDLDFSTLQEIRMRVDAPFILVIGGEECFISRNGGLTGDIRYALPVSSEDLKETLQYISGYSMYAFEDELRQGFITVQGGHRVGVAGKIVTENGKIKTMKYISFLNIRLAHEITGCANHILPYILEGGKLCHSLIVSPPRCGKTTLLRDVIRQLSNGDGKRRGMTVGVVDERSELGACHQGVPQNDLGVRTDILDCCPKLSGMIMLVRSMSPEVIAVDEIGEKEDVEAIVYAMNCGCQMLATAHGRDMDELRAKPVFREMIGERLFKRYVVLDNLGGVGHVSRIFNERGMVLYA